MISLRRKLLIQFFKFFDLLVMTGAFLLAAAVESYKMERISLEDFLGMRIKVQNFVIFLAFILFWHIIFSSFRLYNSRRLSSRREEAFDVLKATSLGTITLIIAAFIFRIKMASPVFLITFWGVSSAISILSRLLLRNTLGWIRLRGTNLQNMLIVGTNQRAIQFAQKIEAPKELGYKILGFVDSKWRGIDEFQQSGYKLVADFVEFPAYLRNNVVDEVMIALPMKSYYQQASRILSQCEDQGVICRYLSDPFNARLPHLKVVHFEDKAIISHYTGVFDPLSLFIKRIIDIVSSLILLISLAPLFLVVSLLIKRDSPGPVFFVQARLGLNKRRFKLYKFRTMISDAEQKIAEVEHLNEVSGPVFKIKNDPRITKIGKFLRKTSIDELPQLINILKGDMSLVGPRPLPVRDYNGFNEDWHRRRFTVRPGITCLWQVNGRSNVAFEKWMQLDMQYIDSRSLLLDLKILAKTIPAVLKGSGAA
jgi:exopolysaccharide biosynthesis polyprenyl glycosylphosphotransferase